MTYYNNRVYTITAIRFDMNPSHTFYHQHMAKDISYADYMKTQYKQRVEDMRQPLIECHIK